MLFELSSKLDLELASCLVVFESTGIYSKKLLGYLLIYEIPCCEESSLQIHRSSGIKRGKDDQIDAATICMYAFMHQDQIRCGKMEDLKMDKLKTLLSRRDLLVNKKKAFLVSLKEYYDENDVELNQLLVEQNEQVIELFKEQIKVLESQIEAILQSETLLKNYRLIRSVPGIGLITSAYLIAYANNFTRFTNSRKFACYSGIAPFPNRSGSTKQGKNSVSHFANKKIKALLSNGILAAIKHDKEIKQYFERKRAEGKQLGTVLNAVKNKIIHRVFAVVKRQSPYVKLMQYA